MHQAAQFRPRGEMRSKENEWSRLHQYYVITVSNIVLTPPPLVRGGSICDFLRFFQHVDIRTS